MLGSKWKRFGSDAGTKTLCRGTADVVRHWVPTGSLSGRPSHFGRQQTQLGGDVGMRIRPVDGE